MEEKKSSVMVFPTAVGSELDAQPKAYVEVTIKLRGGGLSENGEATIQLVPLEVTANHPIVLFEVVRQAHSLLQVDEVVGFGLEIDRAQLVNTDHLFTVSVEEGE